MICARFADFDKNRLEMLVKKYGNLSKACIATGYSKGSIYAIAKYYKFKVANIPYRKYKVNAHYFAKIDSEEKAYWIGFITADGTIVRTRKMGALAIGLAYSDTSHLIKFKKDIGSEHKLYYESCRSKKKGTFCEKSIIRIVCTKLVDDLICLGVTPRKSFTIH